jgi:hypothetical protein
VAVRCSVKVGIVFSASKVLVILQETDRFCYTFCVSFSFRAKVRHCQTWIRGLRIQNADSYGRFELSNLGRLQLTKVNDGLLKTVFERHARLPTKKALRLSNVGLSLLRIILRQPLKNDL